ALLLFPDATQTLPHLAPGGRLVAATRPWRFRDWPMPEKWRESRQERALAEELTSAGLSVGSYTCSYPCEVSLTRWLDFLGTLRPEAKEEIHHFAAGLRTTGGEVYLQFRDRVVFVVGE
ncbi:htxA, partial [Symbiodinium sp. CCMP2456]